MKKLWLAAVLTAGLLGMNAYSDTVTSVNVVGYVNLTVYGGAEDTYTLIAAPMTKMPVARGTISTNTTTTITDGDAAWAANAFAPGGAAAGETGSSTYYVEVTSGAFEGRHFYIASNSGTELTLAAALTDINAGDLAGASYKIIPANRIRDLFGEPGGGQQLAGGPDSGNADNIRLMNQGWTAPIYYKTGAFLPPNDLWMQGTSPANDFVVDRDIGIMVRRRAGGSTVQLTVVGEVSANSQAVIVTPGWSLIGGMNAVPIAIGDTLLNQVLIGGPDSGSADTIRAWTGAGWGAPVYFKTGAFLPPNDLWMQGTTAVGSTFMIQPGTAYLINKKGTEGGVWDQESPIEAVD